MSYDYDRRTAATRVKINKPSEGKNGYIAFFNGKQAEVYADTKLKALELARAHFKAPKSKQHMVHVELSESDGKQVTHKPDF